MRGEKKNLIVVTYGFHPQEYFAEEVGKMIGRMNLENIISVKFTPKCMPERLRELLEERVISWSDRDKFDFKGMVEMRDFLERNYPDLGVHIDLHDTYMPASKKFSVAIRLFYHPRSKQLRHEELKKLGKILKKIYKDKDDIKVVLAGKVLPRGFRYNYITIDFDLPKIEGQEHEIYYSPEALQRQEIQQFLERSVNFTERFIKWIKRYYLNPLKEFPEVSLLFQ